MTKIVYAGTPEFAVPALEALLRSEHEVIAVYTQPDRPAGRGRKPQASPVKCCALQAGLPVLQPADFKSTQDVRRLEQLGDHFDIQSACAVQRIGSGEPARGERGHQG